MEEVTQEVIKRLTTRTRRTENTGEGTEPEEPEPVGKMIQEIRVTEVRALQNETLPHMARLLINEEWEKCMIDTGAAVSLIQQSIVDEQLIDQKGAQELRLTGITGHPIRTYGTTSVEIGVERAGQRQVVEMIVCDAKVLGTINVLLGRDILAKLHAQIDYAEPPILHLWGNEVILIGDEDEERIEEQAIEFIKEESTWREWLNEVKLFYQPEMKNSKNESVEFETSEIQSESEGEEQVIAHREVEEQVVVHREAEIVELPQNGAGENEIDLVESNREGILRDLETTHKGNEKQKTTSQVAIIFSAELISIPPRTELLSHGKIKENPTGEYLVCEPGEIPNTGAYFACTLVPNNPLVPIRILNLSNTEVRIQKGQRIGSAQVAETEESVPQETISMKVIDSRSSTWLSQFTTEHLELNTQEALHRLLREYSDLFLEEGELLPRASQVKHSITLEPGAQPICKAPYRIPYSQRKVLQQEVQRLLDAQVIRPSASPWSAPVVLVTKRTASGGEKVRMCIDYRGLNSVTKKEYYPLPNITDLLQGYKAGNKALFTVIDVAEAYHQIAMEDKDIPLTGFSTYEGHYEYLKMPFGLVNAPSTFQRFMNVTLSGLTGELCMVYLDDIIVFNTEGPTAHIGKIRQIFDRLRAANIKLKPQKCNFLLKKVKYLGHVLTQEGILPDPEKIEAIEKFPIPKNIKGVRSFLGLINWYRRFIPNVTELSAPLVNLTRKDVKFEISEEVIKSIAALKKALTVDSLLIFPDFDQPFLLATDTSGTGVGAVLSQVRNGKERPIAYASRKLNKAEVKYSVTEAELLGVVFGVRTFKCYLYGRKFTIITDHRPLKWLLTMKDPSSRLTRWALSLAEYDFEVIHRPGKRHGNADALSRMYNAEDNYIELSYEEYEEYKRKHWSPKQMKVKRGDWKNLEDVEDYAIVELVTKQQLKGSEVDVGQVVCEKGEYRNQYKMVIKSKSDDTVRYADLWQGLRELIKQIETSENTLVVQICHLEDDTMEELETMLELLFFNHPTQIYLVNGSMYPPRQINLMETQIIEPEWERTIIQREQAKDEFCKSLIETLKVKEDDCINLDDTYYLDTMGILYKKESHVPDRLVLPKTLVNKALRDFHDNPMSGHPGRERTTQLVQTRFFWPNMKRDIEKYCLTCDACNKRKTSPHQKKVPLQRFTVVSEPWELTSMDIVGPLVHTLNGNRYLLTFMDHFTKYAEAIPIPNQKADTVARAFVENVITRHGAPTKLLTDQGTNFTSQLFKEVCKLLNIEKIQTSSYAPSSNGQIERLHRVIKDMLSHYIREDQRDWDQWIPYVMMAYRGTVHSSTGYSPFFLLHGRDQVLPIDDFIRPQRVRYDYDENYAAEMMARLSQVYKRVRENTELAKSKRIVQYNKKTKERNYQLGDLVYLKDMAPVVGKSKKLTKTWMGPYRVIEKVGPVTYRIKRVGGRDNQVVHANRLKEYCEREEPTRQQVVHDQNDSDTDSASQDETTEAENNTTEDEQPPRIVLPGYIDISHETLKDHFDREQAAGYEGTTPKTPDISVRRSERPRKAPERLQLRF